MDPSNKYQCKLFRYNKSCKIPASVAETSSYVSSSCVSKWPQTRKAAPVHIANWLGSFYNSFRNFIYSPRGQLWVGENSILNVWLKYGQQISTVRWRHTGSLSILSIEGSYSMTSLDVPGCNPPRNTIVSYSNSEKTNLTLMTCILKKQQIRKALCFYFKEYRDYIRSQKSPSFKEYSYLTF